MDFAKVADDTNMDFGELQLADDTNIKKERRFSVHDVDPTDNDVSYGQPDNTAMSDRSMRISSADDYDTDQKTTVLSSHQSSQDYDDQHANVFIHENVDNNYDDYSPNDEEQAVQTRGSKEHTPDKNSKNNNNTYDTSHYRHPSLGPNENPVSDDDNEDRDHNRWSSTLIHENADSDYEMTPGDEIIHSQTDLFSKNLSRLTDYWCHSSGGIAIEMDTDKQQQSTETDMSHNVKGSIHEINNYTRPFMSKIENNNKWDSVFGNGIISDTHEKYISHENGQFIEWIIEMNNLTNIEESTCIIGISSDLLGDGDGHSEENEAFTSVNKGFGFDNLGNILHGNAVVGSEKKLEFSSRDVVHIVLDYSSMNNWVFYASVGGIEEEDYKDLKKGCVCVFAQIAPGSYRLAVSLFSQMNALIIESCKIHGTEQASFYQELKSYIPPQTQSQSETQEIEIEHEEKVIEPSISTKKPLIEAKVNSNLDINTETTKTTKTLTAKSEVIKPETQKSENIKIENTQKSEIKTDENENKEESVEMSTEKKFEIEISPAPNSDTQSVSNEDSKLKPLLPQQSVIIHDDVLESSPDKSLEDTPETENETENEKDREQIARQLQSINELKKEISMLKQESVDREEIISAAYTKDDQRNELICDMENTLNEYKLRSAQIQEDILQYKEKENEYWTEKESLRAENERLSHELKLAQDRVQSLDDKKQEMQNKLNRAIESKMKLIISTSEEIDHYRKLIQQIAQNKLGCQLLSDFGNTSNGIKRKNGYY